MKVVGFHGSRWLSHPFEKHMRNVKIGSFPQVRGWPWKKMFENHHPNVNCLAYNEAWYLIWCWLYDDLVEVGWYFSFDISEMRLSDTLSHSDRTKSRPTQRKSRIRTLPRVTYVSVEAISPGRFFDSRKTTFGCFQCAHQMLCLLSVVGGSDLGSSKLGYNRYDWHCPARKGITRMTTNLQP